MLVDVSKQHRPQGPMGAQQRLKTDLIEEPDRIHTGITDGDRWMVERDHQGQITALHHPPIAIGDAGMDAIRLLDQACLEELLRPHRALRAVLFGHIHQHWQGSWVMRPDVLLLGCPSTLCSFKAVQPCPLARADDPGGRLLELTADGAVRHQVLRWSSV